MSELIIAFLIIGLAFAGLSIGLILRNQPIKGSCGGLGNLQDGSSCEICGATEPNSCSKS